MRVFTLFVNAIFWMWLCIVPAGILGFIAFLVYHHSPANLIYSVVISVAGIFLGCRLAEYVRKKYGLDTFFGKLLSTPELEERQEAEQ